jgi:hypothetical protein
VWKLRENGEKSPLVPSLETTDKLGKAMEAAAKSVPQGKRTIGNNFKWRDEKDQAVNTIRLLYGHYEPLKQDFFIEFRGLSIQQGLPVKQKFVSYGELEKQIDDALSWNQKDYNVSFSVNPRAAVGESKQDDIQDVVCLWLDIDGKNFQDGKPEAEKRVLEFRMKPNIIIDSGHGYHCYWILQEPIINRTEDQSKEVKRVLSGLATALGADKQAFNFDRIMRLPGTLNIKDLENPQPCFIVQTNSEHFYSLPDFNTFLDYRYEEPEKDLDVDFKGKTLIVSDKDPLSAIKGVKGLKVADRIERMIITGELQKGPGSDPTRSGRDMAIITALVAEGYDYATAKSVFFNPYLACSGRIREKGEQALRYDVSKAYRLVQKGRPFISPQIERIRLIKGTEKMSAEEKLHDIAKYVVEDLGGLCANYIDKKRAKRHLFDRNKKILINIKDESFESFLKDRYDLPDKDLQEVLSSIRTKIDIDGDEITPYNFARFNKQPGVLYVSNHDNQTFRIDGRRTTLVDNGADGVIFEFRSDYSIINIDPAKAAEADYFDQGFNWEHFKQDSLLFKHVIAKANFTHEEMHDLTPEDQQYLLTIYFYSLFFESIQKEKPLICFKGAKASGKSFMGTAIGQLLFGPAFLPSPLPNTKRDLEVVLGQNYYVVFDNLDSRIDNDILNDLCITATGGSFKNRVLYTDDEEAEIEPRVFLLLTTRTPEFRRDDFVDRLIILDTEKIQNPKSRSALFDEIMNHREEIWGEILINLNSIVRLLNERRDWVPECIFRIADWDTFAMKIHNESGQGRLKDLLNKMNKKKEKFTIEDDPLYIGLDILIYEREGTIENSRSSEVYNILRDQAEHNKDKSFERKYANTRALAQRLANILPELSDRFEIEVRKESHAHTTYYSIRRKERPEDKQSIVAIDAVEPKTKEPSLLDQIMGAKRKKRA